MARRPKTISTLRHPTLLLGAGVLLIALLAFFVRTAGPYFAAAVIQSEVIALTNIERTQNNVGVVTHNALLDKAAQAKAADMAAKGYFAHIGPDGAEPWVWIEGAGYDYGYAGENLAVHFSDSRDVVEAWMASPTHRANIIKPQYQEIGVGVADGMYRGEPVTFVVQYFASPSSSKATEGKPAIKQVSAPAPQKVQEIAQRQVVAGAEVPTPAWWERVIAYLSTALRSLTASAGNAGAESVYIGESGASVAR